MAEPADNIWKINLSNEYGSIGEKVAREWLKQKGYEVYSFQDIMWKAASFQRLKKVRTKRITFERGREFLLKNEEFLNNVFGEKLEDMMEYMRDLRKLARVESEARLSRDYSRVGICPDIVVKKDGDLTFVEVKVNESEPKKYQRASFRTAERHGFKTVMLRLRVQILIQGDIQLTEA